MTALSKMIEDLNWPEIGRMNADELRMILLVFYNEAVNENLKKRRSRELSAIKRKYKYPR